MASSKEYLEYVQEQLRDLREITWRQMMGEYVLYYQGKVVGGIYDDRFLLKVTPSAVKLLPHAAYALPYEGAKKMLAADIDDKELMEKAIPLIAEDLPAPKKKKHIKKTVDRRISISNDASGFVSLNEYIPEAVYDIRYFSANNFVGERIDGYEEALPLLTKEAAAALKAAGEELLEKGYRLKIFDAYRPARATAHFIRWAKDPEDIKMKEIYYPGLKKSELIPKSYIAEKSAHSRGSTVDLTLADKDTGEEIDMGGSFDFFGDVSHYDYSEITEKQKEMRKLLREVMVCHGFKPLKEEWWHFTLEKESYPDTYFDFPVSERSIDDQIVSKEPR